MSSPAAACPSPRWPGRLSTWPGHPRFRPAWWLRTPRCGAGRSPRPTLSYASRLARTGLASRTRGESPCLLTAGRSRSWSRSRGLPSTTVACRRPTCKPGSAMRTRLSVAPTFSGVLTGRWGRPMERSSTPTRRARWPNSSAMPGCARRALRSFTSPGGRSPGRPTRSWPRSKQRSGEERPADKPAIRARALAAARQRAAVRGPAAVHERWRRAARRRRTGWRRRTSWRRCATRRRCTSVGGARPGGGARASGGARAGSAARARGDSGQALARGHEVFASALHACGHGRLGGFAVGARVVGLLVADLAVHPEHAVVVGEHVPRHRPGEGVLGVGVHVHLDHPVGDRLADLLQRRPRPAVEHQVERLFLAVLRADRVGQDVPAPLTEADGLRRGERVRGGAVQLLVDLPDDAVFLAADHADLQFHDGVGLDALIE